ncbi:cadherin domain-containing protein [Blastopirellula retiformator]|uniref:cadherin domain-containing protein n=1 Tax=Blastopirellula retiformator TaxID=2527970 RepID=UPI00164611D6|nr:cadherin domain-containing protein [Blastopirellula retiformator]
MASERLEIRDLLALTTIDLVEDLTIAEGTTRDITLDHISGASSVLVGLKIKGTGGNFDPNVPLIHLKDNPSQVITPVSAMANVNGTTDSLVFFEMGTATLTIEVGGNGGGEFQAEIFLFGDSDGSGMTSEQEYMKASAAQMQGAGTGNQNTALYYKSVWGIDFNQSQYDYEFDLNQNGKVESHELSWVQRNQNVVIHLDLIGDIDPPTIEVGLVDDSAAVDFPGADSDGVTNVLPATSTEAVIRGSITDFSNITGATISGTDATFDLFADTIAEKDLSDIRNITFGLSADDLETLFGTDVTAGGAFTLMLNATDDLGNTYATPINFTFEFDTTAPAAPSIDLTTDTGVSTTDDLTNASTLQFEVTTEAGSIVELFVDGVSAGKLIDGADAGEVLFNLMSQFTTDDDYDITAMAYDAAGNASALSTVLTVTVDRNIDAPVLDLANKSVEAGASATRTEEDNADFEVTVEVGATVTIGGISATDSDDDGKVTISDVPLSVGVNTLQVTYTDEAGNSGSTTVEIVSNNTPVVDNTSLDGASLDETTPDNLNNPVSLIGFNVDLTAGSKDVGETLSYEVSGIDALDDSLNSLGAAGVIVSINAGGVVTISDPTGTLNFENGVRYLTFTVKATDDKGDGFDNNPGEGLTSAGVTFTIDVNDINETPTLTPTTVTGSIDENSAAMAAVTLDQMLTAFDPDNTDGEGLEQTLTYQFATGGNPDGLFDIDGTTGAITLKAGDTLDYEVAKSYQLTIEITDSVTTSAPVTVDITVNDVNEAPEIDEASYSFTIDEIADNSSTAEDSQVGLVSATDPDAADDTSTATNPTFAELTYTLTGTGAENFNVDSAGNIKVAANATLDFETQSVFNLTLTATDINGAGLDSVGVPVTITLNDVNETPRIEDAIYMAGVAEDAGAGAPVSVTPALSAVDPDDADSVNLETLTYSFEGGGLTSGPFTINPADGTITVTAEDSLDFETQDTYVLSIVVTDGVNTSAPLALTVNISDVNEAPVLNATNYTVSELMLQNASGDTGLTLDFTDPEGGVVTFTNLTASESGDNYFTFEVDGNGKIHYTNGPVPPGTYELSFEGTDDGSPAQMFSGTITINVVDNLPPVVDDDEFDVAENLADDTTAFTLTFSEQNGETDGIASVTLQDSAGGAFRLGTLSGNSIDVIIDDTTLIDFESDPTMSITVRVTDGVGSFADYVIDINVPDANDAPTYVGGTNFSTDEFVAAIPPTDGTPADDSDLSPALDLSTAFTDQDASDMGNLTFSIDPASNPDGIFAVQGSKIVVANPGLLDFDDGPTSYDITVQAFDGDATTSQVITISLTPQNELPLPTDGNGTPLTHDAGVVDLGVLNLIFDDIVPADNKAGETLPGGLSMNGILDVLDKLNLAADPEGDTIFFSQIGDVSQFLIDSATGEIELAASLAEPVGNFDDYELFFNYGDGADTSDVLLGATGGMKLAIRVQRNNPPVITPDTASATIAEGTAVDTPVGIELTLTDADVADTILTPALSGQFSGAFKLVETSTNVYSLQVADPALLDYEAVRAVNADGEITLMVDVMDDRGGVAATVALTVTVTDVNEAPSFDNGSFSFTVDEIAPGSATDTGTMLTGGPVAVTDPDAADDGVVPASDASFSQLAFELSGTGAENFEIDANGVITVAAGADLDFETTSQYVLTVSVTDQNGAGLSAPTTATVTIDINDVNEAPETSGEATAAIVIDESQLFAGGNPNFEANVTVQIPDPNQANSTIDRDGYELRFAIEDIVDEMDNPIFSDVDDAIANLTFDVVSGFSYANGDSFVSATVDGNTGELVLHVLHYLPSQNRAPQTITIRAEDPDGLFSAEADLTIKFEVENIVDVQIRAVKDISANDGTGGGVTQELLPGSESLTLVADDSLDNTFYYELWVSVNYGADQAAPGRVYFDGMSLFNYNLQYDNRYLNLVTSGFDQLDNTPIAGLAPSFFVNGDDGYIFNIVGLMSTVATTGNNSGVNGNGAYMFPDMSAGDYARIATMEFTLDTNLMEPDTSDQLISLFYGDPAPFVTPTSGPISVLLDPTGATGDGGPVLEATAEAQVTVVSFDQISENTSMTEVVTDFLVFDVNASPFSLNLTGNDSFNSKFINNAFTAQNPSGSVSNLTGKLYVQILDATMSDPAKLRIVAADLQFDMDESYTPADGVNPNNADDAAPANLGLESGSRDFAFRNMELMLSEAIELEITGDFFGGSMGLFDSQEMDLFFSSGRIDQAEFKSVEGIYETTETDLTGSVVDSYASESGTITATDGGSAGFADDDISLTFNLKRALVNQPLSPGAATLVSLFGQSTITATYDGNGGGVPLMGTVSADGGQPLEEGSGVFMSVVDSPTAMDENGEIAALPVSNTWQSEWDTFWVEVWGNTADAAGIQSGVVDLKYNTNLFTATKIEYASTFDQNRGGLINDVSGVITNLGSGTSAEGVGKDGFVLLGRVRFQSLVQDGLSIEDGLQYGPASLDLEITRGQLELTDQGLVRASTGDAPNLDVWAVPYDLDDDGNVSLVDLMQIVRNIGNQSIAVDDAMTAATDFNNDGYTSLEDLTLLVRNVGVSKATAENLSYPTTFTQLWVGSGLVTDGPDTVDAIFTAANAAWAEALGLDEPLDVRLEVTNLSGAQLGEAKLVGLNEEGLPVRGVLTIDSDGAGFGWSTDLEGGPSSDQYDLYTVMMHELGHLYGFMPQYSAFGEHIETFEDSVIFVGDMFAVEMDARGEHVNADLYSSDLMSPYLAPGIRKEISSLNVEMILTAYASADENTTVDPRSAALTEQSADGQSPVIVSPVTETTTVEIESVLSTTSFVLGDDVADLSDVSGRTGVAVVMPETTRRTLEQNGIAFKTLSNYSAVEAEYVSEAMTDVDTYFDDSSLIESTISDIDVSESGDAEDESLDDLFAEWDEIEMA